MLYYLAGVLIGSWALSCAQHNNGKENHVPPNIIWLVAEDQSPHFFPMYGDSTISLPHLEALADDGIVFKNAYAPVPVCAPARSALITGMFPTTLGTHNMRTYNAYNPDNQPEIQIQSYSPLVPEGVKMFTEYLRKEGYYCTNNAKEDYNFKTLESAWDDSSENGHWRNRAEGQPFFSVFNFGICHESGIWRQHNQPLSVAPKKVPVPPYFPNNETIQHDLAVNYSNLKRMDEQLGKIIQQLKDEGLYENSIIFFYADHGGPFPRHKRALYETGTKVPLIIKFNKNKKTEDYNTDLVSFVDFAPTVLSLAGIKPPRVMQGKALFGRYRDSIKRTQIFTSSDRFDEVSDRLRAVRQGRYKYIRNFNPEISNALPVSYREQMPMMQKLLEMYKADQLDSLASQWFRVPKPEEELYDLEKDPFELQNLAGDIGLKDTLQHLRKILKDWIKSTNDLGQFSEKELLTSWLAEGEQPKLKPLELEEQGDSVFLISKKADATLIWRPLTDSVWHIYSGPIARELPFHAKAVRIGYQDSEILRYETE